MVLITVMCVAVSWSERGEGWTYARHMFRTIASVLVYMAQKHWRIVYVCIVFELMILIV